MRFLWEAPPQLKVEPTSITPAVGIIFSTAAGARNRGDTVQDNSRLQHKVQLIKPALQASKQPHPHGKNSINKHIHRTDRGYPLHNHNHKFLWCGAVREKRQRLN